MMHYVDCHLVFSMNVIYKTTPDEMEYITMSCIDALQSSTVYFELLDMVTLS